MSRLVDRYLGQIDVAKAALDTARDLHIKGYPDRALKWILITTSALGKARGQADMLAQADVIVSEGVQASDALTSEIEVLTTHVLKGLSCAL